MKKIFCTILAAVLVFTLFLCGCTKKQSGKASINSLTYKADEIELFAQENGFDFTVHNGTSEFMTEELLREELVYSLGKTAIENIFSLIGSEKYPYVKDVRRDNNDFRNITVSVGRKGFEKADKGDELSAFIGRNCLVYFKYDNETELSEKTCTVKIVDSETEMILSENIYALSDLK